MPAYQVTIYYTNTSGAAKTWSGKRSAPSKEIACGKAADDIRGRPSVMVVTGGIAVEA